MKNDTHKTILLTAFEPSGDALGAMAAVGLRAIDADIKLVGLGGSLMESAGVELLAQTTSDAAMGVGAITEIKRIKRLVDLTGRWIVENQPDVVVAVDSPAANWHICKVAKKHGRSVVHLAAPQLWAWAPWRVRKMRRLSDHVMCLLPFEPAWFERRGVSATFIGHPAFEPHTAAQLSLPQGSPNIVLLPGSRAKEISSNLPMQHEILKRICLEFQGTEAVIACRSEDEHRVTPLAQGIQLVTDNIPSAVEWADLALTVSGTVSLHVMRHATPMIGMYKVNALSRMLTPIVLTTKNRLLPNLIAGKRIVPEFVPCGNIAAEIADVAIDLLSNDEAMSTIQQALQQEAALYKTHHPSSEAAEIILSFA